MEAFRKQMEAGEISTPASILEDENEEEGDVGKSGPA